MEKPIRVRVMSREFALRVRPEDEAATREFVAYVDGKMRRFREAHPEQSELTAAIIAALALAEELYAARDAQGELQRFDRLFGEELAALEERLADALPAP